jgi:3'(2'), 5'-bisphosphate nucleotidase
MEQFIEPVKTIITKASHIVMRIYKQDFSVFNKDDKRPLTLADLECNKIITEGLSAISNYPILSEEGNEIAWSERRKWNQYWLVDPIDGTKEFIKKNDEFTINIALITNGVPVFGVVAAPALNATYFGIQGLGAWKIDNHGKHHSIKVNPPPKSNWKVIVSRSHVNKKAVALFASSLPGSELITMGSSLKFCLIAEGNADIYPRFGPTSEWDTAAAQAIVTAAGGKVIDFELNSLRYNTKNSLVNPGFVVCSKIDILWSDFIKQYLRDG